MVILTATKQNIWSALIASVGANSHYVALLTNPWGSVWRWWEALAVARIAGLRNASEMQNVRSADAFVGEDTAKLLITRCV